MGVIRRHAYSWVNKISFKVVKQDLWILAQRSKFHTSSHEIFFPLLPLTHTQELSIPPDLKHFRTLSCRKQVLTFLLLLYSHFSLDVAFQFLFSNIWLSADNWKTYRSLPSIFVHASSVICHAGLRDGLEQAYTQPMRQLMRSTACSTTHHKSFTSHSCSMQPKSIVNGNIVWSALIEADRSDCRGRHGNVMSLCTNQILLATWWNDATRNVILPTGKVAATKDQRALTDPRFKLKAFL